MVTDKQLPGIYGLLGRSLEHSLSPSMFAPLLPHLNPISAYVPFPVEPDDLARFFAAARFVQVRGINVTVPYKVDALTYCDQKTEECAAVGATNCIRFSRDGVIGHNTDVSAFRDSLSSRSIADRRAVVLGSGGAARAVVLALKELSYQAITVVTRDRTRDEAIPLFRGCRLLLWSEELEAAVCDAGLVVNATPLGMYPQHHFSPVSMGFRGGQLVYDLVYNPFPTKYLEAASKAGASTCDGLEMLARQAVTSLHFWMGATVAWQKLYASAEKQRQTFSSNK